MKPKIDVKLRIALLFTLWVTASFTAFALVTMDAISESALQIERTHQIHTLVSGATSRIVQLEALQSRYLLTGSRDYLAEYRTQSRLISIIEGKLLALTRSNPAQFADAEKLSELLSQRMAMLDHSVRTFQDDGRPAAVAEVMTNGSIDVTRRIDRISRDMHDRESRVEVECVESSHRKAEQAAWSGMLAGGFGMWMIGLVLVIMAREVMSTRRAEEAVRRLHEEKIRANEELEQRVRQRTAELAEREIQLKAAKEAAEAANVEKSRFLASMSHELRTPLNAIIGFSEMLQDGNYGPLTEKQTRQLGHVVSGGRHLLSLINDILDISKVEAGKMEIDVADFDAIDAIHETVECVLALATAKDIHLITNVPPKPLRMSADQLKFKQMLYNLLSNAIKFTPSGGNVTLTAAVDAGSLIVSVADTGIGIASADMDRLFRNFEQIKSTYGSNQQGTGLGLALTRKLAELHDGEIHAESAGEGEGSCFTLIIPLRQPAPGNLAAAA